MKTKKNIILVLLICSLTIFTSCGKNAEENPYVSKEREVDSIFDHIKLPAPEEREKIDIEDNDTNQNDEEDNSDNELELVTRKVRSNVNLRTEPSTESDIIIVVPGGSEIEILSENQGDTGDWTKIRFENNEGYISNNFL